MNYFDNWSMTISWNKTLRIVEQKWKGQATSKEFRASAEKVLALLKEKNATKLLRDTRKMTVILPDDQEWTKNDWMPRMAQAGLKKVAVVIPGHGVAKLSINKMKKVVHTEEYGVERALFDDIEQARSWLNR